MNIIEKSLEIALRAYGGKQDKAGKAYVLHPLRMMLKMDTEEEMSVALLHDVIEDSDITSDDLLQAGIPSTVVDAVVILSKKDNESYDAFIDRVLGNSLAAKIKTADIEDNINVLRLDSLSDSSLERVRKYHKAWKRLQSSV